MPSQILGSRNRASFNPFVNISIYLSLSFVHRAKSLSKKSRNSDSGGELPELFRSKSINLVDNIEKSPPTQNRRATVSPLLQSRSLADLPFTRQPLAPPQMDDPNVGTLTIKNAVGCPEVVAKIRARVDDAQSVVLQRALEEFQLQDDPDSYFLTWNPERANESVLLQKTDFPLAMARKRTSGDDLIFSLKKIPTLGGRFSKRDSSPKQRERSRTTNSVHTIFKGPDDSDSASQDGNGSPSPPSTSPSPSPSTSPRLESTSLTGRGDSLHRSQPKPLSKLSEVAFLASSQDSLDKIGEATAPLKAHPLLEKRLSFTRSSMSSPDLTNFIIPVVPAPTTPSSSPPKSVPNFPLMRGRALSSSFLPSPVNNDYRPVVRGTIRVSLKNFQEADYIKTVPVDSLETTSQVVAKAMAKWNMAQNPEGYTLQMNRPREEVVLDAEEHPLALKLRAYKSIDPLDEPTFLIIPKPDEKSRKRKTKRTAVFSVFGSSEDPLRKRPNERPDILESFMEKMSDRAEKISLALDVEVQGVALFHSDDFTLLPSETSRQFVQKVLEAAQLKESPENFTLFRPSVTKGEKPVKPTDVVTKQIVKSKGKAVGVFTVRRNLL